MNQLANVLDEATAVRHGGPRKQSRPVAGYTLPLKNDCGTVFTDSTSAFV